MQNTALSFFYKNTTTTAEHLMGLSKVVKVKWSKAMLTCLAEPELEWLLLLT